MANTRLASKDIRLAIPHLPKVARTLLNKGKVYNPLLLEVLKYDAFTEEDQHFPSNKELQALTKLSPAKYNTQLEAMYKDFMSAISDENTELNFGNILVRFYVRGIYEVSVTFYAGVMQLPRVGDNLDLPFLRPYFKINAFYVQSVHHYFENDKQDLSIWVKEGVFNLFEHMELEQAKSENRYDWKTDRITEPPERHHQQSYSSSKRFYGGKHW